MEALSNFLGFSAEQRQRCILRTDSGFGCDENLNHALQANWQVVSKGYGGRRSVSLAKKIAADTWIDLGNDRWAAPTVHPPHYERTVQHLVLRWKTQQGEIKHSVLVCSIPGWSLSEVVHYYDARGACETEIQADKAGLKMERRRKMSLQAQEALILITDLAHNTLAWTSAWMFSKANPLSAFGSTRLIEDLFTIQGRLIFDRRRLCEIQLNQLHPHAEQVADGLRRLLDHFGNP